MDLYKIGLGYYDNELKSDRNSGLYEYDMIAKALKNCKVSEKTNILIIVGGKPNEDDFRFLNRRLKSNLYKKKIFIATDFNSLENCKEFIAQCDALLHQSLKTLNCVPHYIEQRYNFIPELFYTNDVEKPKHQMDMVIFGGNNLNRQDKINEYIFDSEGKIRNYIFSLYKDYNTGEDIRLDYKSYIKLTRMFKYSLIIVRKECRECHWVTSRFVEAISNWNFPLVDFEYDKSDHFEFYERVHDEFEVWKTMLYYGCNECDRLNVIRKYREILNKNKNKFTEVIEDVCR